MLAFENQVTQPEVLATWYRGDRRAKWRAEVASGQASVTSQMWVDVLKRMCDASAAVSVKRELGSAWLPLCDDPSAKGHAREDMDVTMWVLGLVLAEPLPFPPRWSPPLPHTDPPSTCFLSCACLHSIGRFPWCYAVLHAAPVSRVVFGCLCFIAPRSLPSPLLPSPPLHTHRAGGAAEAAAEAAALSTFLFCTSEVLQQERAAGVLATLKACLLEFEQVLCSEGTVCGIVYPTWQAFSEQWRVAVQGTRTLSQVRCGSCARLSLVLPRSLSLSPVLVP
jgi:hypothetical protein